LISIFQESGLNSLPVCAYVATALSLGKQGLIFVAATFESASTDALLETVLWSQADSMQVTSPERTCNFDQQEICSPV
jgi:hypothetical protein